MSTITIWFKLIRMNGDMRNSAAARLIHFVWGIRNPRPKPAVRTWQNIGPADWEVLGNDYVPAPLFSFDMTRSIVIRQPKNETKAEGAAPRLLLVLCRNI